MVHVTNNVLIERACIILYEMLVIICIWKIKLSVGVYETRLIGFIDPAIIKINIIFTCNLMEAAVIWEKRFPRCGATADPHLPGRVISGDCWNLEMSTNASAALFYPQH